MTLARSNAFIYSDLDWTLRQQFGKAAFRPQQKEIIQAALGGKDVFVQASTSYGKSLCYQLPAVVDQGITIVVSPLLSLMMNQVEALRTAGINASSLNSTTPLGEKDRIYKDLQTGHPRIRLLYVTPELCAQPRFRDRLTVVYEQRELARIAIDEAHCISEWGHDFRKDFKRLSWFRESFPDVPIMCLTATANAQVRRDVLASLGLDGDSDRMKIFTMTAHRPNLHFEIRFTQDEDDRRLDHFLKWIRGVFERRAAQPRKAELNGERIDNVPGIIYTISRDECESLASQLRSEGVGAQPFHAKLPKEIKEQTLAKWVSNQPGYDIIVATTAFGMGIDKLNVRFVCHWRLPKSFEGYYQEAGRAGRDGNAASCFLYYSREDRDRVSSMVMRDRNLPGSNFEARAKSLQALVEYCESTNACRHRMITRYFGERDTPVCDYACDWHKDAADLQKRFLRGLASEEFVSTQRDEGLYEVYWED
ncbi:P-loop containing nucleoside triphosphate hydrolase protein [Pseudomassariella vexata]|uniref:ATP-dependent DNA helicase n=1 Tax=Pseudomassariella vexata TaxID=1141098 RepID=A0A1Y2DYF5_9PEZI|nr:P-loop containing nucleoside triphosphate hydrolase protein [Pseudomassariella vexata]ORY64338.1 P-loop containing nucleoside triphosphate hydrolase protein [Pseudomassariella vexata]